MLALELWRLALPRQLSSTCGEGEDGVSHQCGG